jgi:cyclic pyranopterin phosphate synthase
MPESGIAFAKKQTLLSISEMKTLCSILAEHGVDKIRLTGGEPFVRPDVMDLIEHITTLTSLREVSITTNATLIGPHIEKLEQLGIHSVNISLDAIESDSFKRITRRDHFEVVYDNLMRLIASKIKVRINCIVLEGQNESEIFRMLELQEKYDVDVRFLEEMPFNGGTRDFIKLNWNHKRILDHIAKKYPDLEKQPAPITSTSVNYKIPGHTGTFGIIPSFSRTFCGSCNRLRVTATGDLITCLYAKPVANLREALRTGTKEELLFQLERVIGSRAKDGFESQEISGGIFGSSMTSIGG